MARLNFIDIDGKRYLYPVCTVYEMWDGPAKRTWREVSSQVSPAQSCASPLVWRQSNDWLAIRGRCPDMLLMGDVARGFAKPFNLVTSG